MITIYISEDVRGNKLELLLEFIRVRVTKVSVSRYYKGGLELEDIQKRYLDSIVESDEVRRLYYEKKLRTIKKY